MLCSKPSKWLRRLRSSRGFPDSDHINLEHFLSNSLHKIDPQTSTDSAPPDKRPRLEKRDDGESIQGRDMINNALSELFQMGEFQDTSRIKRKKSCRKQQCPRICVLSTNSDAQDVPVQKDKESSPSPSPSPLPLPLTSNNRRKVKEPNQELKVTERVEEEEEKGYSDLPGYSQTEVTIIDTSVPSWKFEKMLYRRKNIWKIGDKKGKGLMSGERKKRKKILNENGDGDVEKKKLKLCSSSSKSGDAEEGGLKKKKKKKKKRLQACNSLNYVEKEEAIIRSKSTQGHEHCKTMVAAYEKKQDSCSQVQDKSFSLKKQIDGGSSVILIKSIPTTNKKDNSGIIPKSGVKPMQK